MIILGAMTASVLPIFSGNSSIRSQDRFLLLSEEYRDYAREAGVSLVPYRGRDLPLFSNLEEVRKAEILHALETTVNICRSTKAQGKPMTDSPSLLWNALKELGLRPPSDLFGRIPDGEVVEIYSSRNIQLFRSFTFFKYCSYTLEELYCRDWVSLFARDDQKIVDLILDFLFDVFTGQLDRTASLSHIPNHTVRETESENRFVLEVGMKWGAPLYLEGESTVAAAIVVETGKLIDIVEVRLPPSAVSDQAVFEPALS